MTGSVSGSVSRRVSADGVGDVVLAGASSGYDHLRSPHPRAGRTVGDLFRAAQAAAARGDDDAAASEWREVAGPRPGEVHRHVLAVGGFAPLPDGGPLGGMVYLVRGQVHAIATAPDGRLLAVRPLRAGSGWVCASRRNHQLINTGSAPALVVHAR